MPVGADDERDDAERFEAPAYSREIPVRKVPTSPRVLVVFSIAGAVVTLFYLFWFAVAYPQPHVAMMVMSIVVTLGYCAAFLTVRTRHTTAAAIAIVTMASVVLVPYTWELTTASDSHMLYLAVGFAMLALFPEHLFKLRIVYSVGIISLVVACEFFFPLEGPGLFLEVSRDQFVASANRMWTVAVSAAAMAVVLYRSIRRQRALSGAAERGEFRANTDPMTGISNRRPVLASLRELDEQGCSGYAIAIIDIDSFKKINDRLGHEEGDALISTIALRLRAHFRQTDLVSRWGGDEFLVLVKNVERDELYQVLERLRVSVADSPLSLGADPIAVTLSIGAAIANGIDASRATINAADQALYAAKQTGRNRVVLAESSVSENA